jgi:hypothetical protein
MHQNHHNFKEERHLITAAEYLTAFSVTSLLGTVGGMTLKCILEKKNVKIWTGFN